MTVAIDVDLRGRLGEARDQGRRPTCLAFAASAAHEASRGTPEHLSTEYLFYNGVRRSHRDPGRGLTATAVHEALEHDGQPIEPAWPYLPSTPDVAAWKPPTIAEARYKIMHKALLAFESRSVSQVRRLVSQGTPVLLVVAVTLAMYTPAENGIVRAPKKDTVTARRHALLAVGSGRGDGGEYILVRNSWGHHWGYLGHAWLQDAYLAKHLETTAVIS